MINILPPGTILPESGDTKYLHQDNVSTVITNLKTRYFRRYLSRCRGFFGMDLESYMFFVFVRKREFACDAFIYC